MNRDRHAADYLLVLFCTLSLGALCLPLSSPVRSFKALVSYLVHPAPYYGAQATQRLAGIPAGVSRLIATDVENQRLKRGLERLPLVEAELQALRLENERLRGEAGLRPPQGRVLRWAAIIERDAANWYRTFMVNAGKEDGVEIGAPVLGSDGGRLGVVGRVTEAGPRWSKVLLIMDETSSVAAHLSQQQWEGLVEGQGERRLRMNYLPMDAQLQVGDSVHTSPTSATFPADVPLGKISRVHEQDPFLTFQSVEVAPEVDPAKLKEVMILLPQKVLTAEARPRP